MAVAVAEAEAEAGVTLQHDKNPSNSLRWLEGFLVVAMLRRCVAAEVDFTRRLEVSTSPEDPMCEMRTDRARSPS